MEMSRDRRDRKRLFPEAVAGLSMTNCRTDAQVAAGIVLVEEDDSVEFQIAF